MKNPFFVACLCVLFVKPGFTQNEDSSKHSIIISHDYYHFDKQFTNDWHISAIQYKKLTGIGAAIARVSHANRLSRTGWQAEAEAYPRISKRIYAYVGMGYSPDVPVFPKFRSGASLYFALPQGWELEGGYRQLRFDKNVWVGTGGVSKYAGAWLFNFRSFAADGATGIDQSHFLTARYYFGKTGQYSWLQLGSGISPDDARNVQLNGKSKLSSKRINMGVTYLPGKRSIIHITAGYSRDEYFTDVHGNQFFGSLGYGLRF